MNLKDKLSSKKQEQFFTNDPAFIRKLSKTLTNWISISNRDVVIICIGTDRSTGDCLGPLTGTLLTERKNENFSVYGTLDNPIHAVNMEQRLDEIKMKHNEPFIIAIDACLGKLKSIGSILTGLGPIQPGAALNKNLPLVGDVYISAVVNISGYMEYLVLQNTRLHVVMDMAKKITTSLHRLDREINITNKLSELNQSDKSLS
ncbi:spore protease YyaC [Aquibacillus rhizosphaerae]|uniref:Spore protease YyaC n=1 Tax=Aquibacillus rhizosphaerae TaxID=3051431 RepID=A0ABT7L4Z1_9BACI|nr:spore protease YyaC [Aquibacillus sp. LR5S19]MDL4840938.1 spore protease YyaC [Aquibacillus sp. LR5S19]